MAQLSGAAGSKRNDLTERLPLLERWLGERLGADGAASVTSITGGPSGLSNATYFLDVAGPAGEEKLVLRMAPDTFTLIPGTDLTAQYEVPKVLAAHGIPVAPVRWLERDPSVLGNEFLVMDRVEGEVCSDRRPGYHGKGVFADLDEPGRQQLWWRTVDAMAAVHRLGPAPAPELACLGSPSDGIQTLDAELAKIEHWMEWGGASEHAPFLLPALDWVKQNRPSPQHWGLCWGDAKIGNILYRDSDVAALLDWELAHFGPPELDLAYFVIVDEVAAQAHDVPRLAGLPGEAETIAHYEQSLGRKVEDFDYYRTLTALRLATLLLLTNRVAQHMGWNFFPPGFLENNPTTRILLDQLARVR